MQTYLLTLSNMWYQTKIIRVIIIDDILNAALIGEKSQTS